MVTLSFLHCTGPGMLLLLPLLLLCVPSQCAPPFFSLILLPVSGAPDTAFANNGQNRSLYLPLSFLRARVRSEPRLVHMIYTCTYSVYISCLILHKWNYLKDSQYIVCFFRGFFPFRTACDSESGRCHTSSVLKKASFHRILIPLLFLQHISRSTPRILATCTFAAEGASEALPVRATE